MVHFYGYNKCATCRKAKAFLQAHGVGIREYDITKTAPSKTLLSSMLKSGACQLNDLFNRSGEMYRALKLSEKRKTMSEAQLLDLLSTHGRLVKRPLITDGTRHTVGFDEAQMTRVWT